MSTPTEQELAAAFPVIQGEGRFEVERIEASRLRVRLICFAAGDISSIKEQELEWESLKAGGGAAEVAERARRWLADPKCDLEAAMPRDLVRARMPFRPVGPFDESDPPLWRQQVIDAVWEQATEGEYEERFDRLADWSVAPRTVFYLRHLDALVGANGFEVFLGQAYGEDVTWALDALRDGACPRLERRYREALGVAADQGFEMTMYVDDRWLDRERAPLHAESRWRVIDSWEEGGSWWLLREELQPALARYVDAHRAELVARRAPARPPK